MGITLNVSHNRVLYIDVVLKSVLSCCVKVCSFMLC